MPEDNITTIQNENNLITNPLHLFFQEIEIAIKIGPGQSWGVKNNIDLVADKDSVSN